MGMALGAERFPAGTKGRGMVLNGRAQGMSQDTARAWNRRSLAAGHGNTDARHWMARMDQAGRAFRHKTAMQAQQTATLWIPVALAVALTPPLPRRRQPGALDTPARSP